MKEHVRSCLICRQRAAKDELLRVVWNGTLVWDTLQRLPGRGAYLHRRAQCWLRMREPKRWKQALRISSEIGPAELSALQEQIRGAISDLSAGEVEARGRPSLKGR